ncbi:heavy-metal-associated domain-containing protein [Frigidibacter sp. MR17.14]|uniref:heavy-metal-associated domain-containing protein n=1 Tax=Frigidibacter sp. MR17.14 TaxID=3126509 RepID=UPI003012F070
MILSVPDMSCGHCRGAVQEAVTGVDAGATLTFDQAARRVDIATKASPEAIIAALDDAGYPASLAS